jgi:hypothetical protein
MRSLALGLSIFLVLIGAFLSRRYQLQNSQKIKQEVLSESEEGKKDTSPTQGLASPTLKPAEPTPKPENPPASLISDYIYPGSSVKSQIGSSLVLESSDDPGKITDWYKEKIKSKKLNAVSFVTTTANDNVLNQLEAAGENESVSVEIKKEPGSSTVAINVSISP